MDLRPKVNLTILWSIAVPTLLMLLFASILVVHVERLRHQKIQALANLSAGYYGNLLELNYHATDMKSSKDLLKVVQLVVSKEYADKVYLMFLDPSYQFVASSPDGLLTSLDWKLKCNSFYNLEKLNLFETGDTEPKVFAVASSNVFDSQEVLLGYLMVAVQFTDFTNLLLNYRWIFMLIALIVIVLASWGVQVTWHNMLINWDELQTAVDEIADGQISHPIPIQGETELSNIGKVIHELRNRVKEQTAMIRDMKTQLHQLDELKQRFIGTVSHELRTPLVAIKSSLDLMQIRKRATLDEESIRLIQLLSRNTAKLQKISENLLDALKSGDASLQLKPEKVLIANMIDEITSELKPLNRIYHVLNQVSPALFITYDRMKLQALFTQILDNAFRFTPDKGKIILSASESGNHVILSIEDNGKGIPPEYKHAIFHQFFQVEENLGGQGLGLYIAKNIVEQAGGKIWVKTELGKGSIFYIQIPKEPAVFNTGKRV